MKIWKYEIKLRDKFMTFEMYRGSKVVHVDCQRPEVVTFWAIVQEKPFTVFIEPRRFGIFGTGSEIPNEYNHYHGTVLDNGFVWHLFEAQ